MRLFFAILGFSALAHAADLPYLDPSFGCIDQANADRYTRDFSIDVASFGGMELCQSRVDTKKLFNDLQIVEGGKFASAGSNNLIRGFVAADQYYPWLKSMTHGVQRGNDVPYATAYNRWGQFTMQDGWAQLSTLGRVGTVVHEARHTSGYRHYPCKQGSYANVNLDACDTDYATGGSHAVEMEYYARVSVMGQNFHPVYKSMARLMAAARANFVFNQPVFKKREAVLAVERGGDAVLFDRGRAITREVPAINGRVKRTSFGAVVFDGLKAFAIEMYENTGFRPTTADGYSYFKLLDRPGAAMKDVEEYDVGVRRFFASITADDRVSSFNFPSGDWGAWKPAGFKVARTATILSNGQRGYFLIGEAGDIHSFDGATTQVGPALAERWNANDVDLALDDSGKILVLGTDGRLRTRNGGLETDWAPAQNSVWSAVVNVPLYDAFDVRP